MANEMNLSIDDILSELGEERKDRGTPQKTWSLDEIDALLGIEKRKSAEERQEKDNTVTEKEETHEEYEEDTSYDESEVDESVSDELEDADDFGQDDEFEENDEFDDGDDFEQNDELEDDDDLDDDDEEEEIEEPDFEPEKTSESRTTQKTRVFDSKVIKAKPKETPEEVPLHAYEFSDADEEGSENQTQMVMELADESEPAEDKDTDGATKQEPKKSNFEKKALAQKTVGIYPVRNENIEHQIMTEKIEKSNGRVMETDRYRERFLNVPKQKLERTADYELLHKGENQDPIERDGRIIKKSKFTNTADLEPIPTIVSADAELSSVDKTIVAGGSNTILHDDDDDGVVGQIKLVGFGEEEEIEQIDEEHAEEALKEKRDKKVASFKLDPNFADIPTDESFEEEEEEDDGYTPKSAFTSDFIDYEYEKPEDKDKIFKALGNAKKATGICAIVQAVLTVVALVITGIISKGGGNLELVGGSPIGCGIINIVILLLASLCGMSTLIKGFKGIRDLSPNASTGTFIVVVACLLQNVVVTLFTSDAYTTVSLYTAAGCVALALASVARYIALARTFGNFEFVTNGTGLYSSEKISGEDDAFEIGRGLLIGDPEICYNAQMERPSYFIENSFEDDPADAYAHKIIYAVLGASVLLALIFGIIRHDFIFAFGVFAAVCSVGIPAFSLIASNIALFFVNRDFNKNGAAIVGHRAVLDSTDINAYVLDSTDIFKKGSCSIIGIKTFQQMRIDDAILYAAALVIESGGPLADVFDGVILGKKDLLPPVESLAYEERLGLSAWIHGRRILLGTRDLLVNHNVKAPDKDFEVQYTHDGRKVMYLAIAGKISAMFVIKYQADKHMRRYLQNVDRAGVSLLIRSCDCNITEEMICRYFNLPLSAVKILSPVSGDIFQKYRNEEIETAPAGIIHNGTIEASLKSVYEAREINADIPVNNMIATIYSVMAVLLFIVIGAMAGSEGAGITGGQIVSFQLLWTAIATIIPVLKRRFNR